MVVGSGSVSSRGFCGHSLSTLWGFWVGVGLLTQPLNLNLIVWLWQLRHSSRILCMWRVLMVISLLWRSCVRASRCCVTQPLLGKMGLTPPCSQS